MPNVTFLEDTEEDAGTSVDAAATNLCKICNTAKGKYTCPRCNVNYCSVVCYQAEAHISCSEAFYRDCVLEDMGVQEDDPDSKRKMMEILQRLQQNEIAATDAADEALDDGGDLDSDDESEERDLGERLAQVNLDDADSVWAQLTPAERQDFEDLVRGGDVSQLLPAWDPWWAGRKKRKMVVDVEEEAEEVDHRKACPAVKKDVPSLAQITKAAPSALVAHNLSNVLGAYCYVARWFNGDHLDFSAEAVQALGALSGNLAHGHNYLSTEVALEAVAHEAVNCTWLGGCPESTALMKSDVACIQWGPEDSSSVHYLQAALSDVHALLSAARKAKPADNASQFARRFGDNAGASAMPALTKEKLRLYTKKVEYLLSWTKDYATKIYSSNIS